MVKDMGSSSQHRSDLQVPPVSGERLPPAASHELEDVGNDAAYLGSEAHGPFFGIEALIKNRARNRAASPRGSRRISTYGMRWCDSRDHPG